MIDYLALALGHGLLAIALLRLVMRKGLDDDPLIAALNAETDGNRKATSIAGRKAARRVRGDGPADATGDEADPSRSSSEAVARKTPRSSSEAVARQE